MPPGMSYPNPKLANNAHNVPIFGNWAAHTMKRRVVDPIHGEKFIYPNEYDFKPGFGEMTLWQSLKARRTLLKV